MIYQLPTQSSRTYRGQYPFRIHSFGGSRGCYHVELNDGRRYVFQGGDISPSFRTRALNFVGRALTDVLNPGATVAGVPLMSVADYAAVLFVIRLARLVRVSQFDRYSIPSNWSNYLATGAN